MAGCSSDDSQKLPEIDWLYPDLLSKDGLIYILKQRYIGQSDEELEKMEKEDLVNLYYSYILPRPQRQYKQNRRGREMTKKQIIMAKKRKLELPDEKAEPSKKKFAPNNKSAGLVNSFDIPTSRLKPPPSCVNFEKKTVKLNSSSTTKNEQEKVSLNKPSPNKTIKLSVPSTKEKSSEEGSKVSPDKKKFSKITWP